MVKIDKDDKDSITVSHLTTGDLFTLPDHRHSRVLWIMGRNRTATELSGDGSGLTSKLDGMDICIKENYQLVEI